MCECDSKESAEDADNLEAQERADAAARATVQAEAAKKANVESTAREAAGLPAKLKRSVRQETQWQKQQRRPKNSALPLKLRRKLTRTSTCIAVLCKNVPF